MKNGVQVSSFHEFVSGLFGAGLFSAKQKRTIRRKIGETFQRKTFRRKTHINYKFNYSGKISLMLDNQNLS